MKPLKNPPGNPHQIWHSEGSARLRPGVRALTPCDVVEASGFFLESVREEADGTGALIGSEQRV
ncbi:MAG: hypothetical protein ACLTMP_13865 [Eggerthella lenta]